MKLAEEEIAAVTGSAVAGRWPLSGGCVGEVYAVELADGRRLVAKVGGSGSLALEGWMLGYLAAHSTLPVPEVIHASDRLLLLALLPSDGRIDGAAERDAARHLAALHGVTATAFGLDRDTLIGPLPQPNPLSARWVPFFAEWRLLYMAGLAAEAGQLPGPMRRRVDILAGRLDRWLDEPAAPSLLHGDMWAGNVLCRQGQDGCRIAGFIDPAIYYGDPEIELAYATLFNTFGRAFFDEYRAIRPLRPGFFEVRRDLYNLYPLLVHLRLFGQGYVGSVEQILRRFGV